MVVELVYNESDDVGKFIKAKLDQAEVKYDLIKSTEYPSKLYYLDEEIGVYYIDAFINFIKR